MGDYEGYGKYPQAFGEWLVYEIDDDVDVLVAAPARNLELFLPDRGLTHWSYWLCSLNRHAGHLHSQGSAFIHYSQCVYHLQQIHRSSTINPHRSRTPYCRCNPFSHPLLLDTTIWFS